ncbi:MAG TPA: hypothetical protein VKB17_00475 [Thermoleophilaceae bacterium]|nr:hypothetical protein [Thermoleophilaceae bacterium]
MPAHRPRYPGSTRSSDPQAAFRKRTLKRYGERCLACGATEGIEAHHLDEQEGVPLCRRCHRKVEAAKRRAMRRRFGR